MAALTAAAGPAVRDGRFSLITTPIPPAVSDVSEAVAAANRMRQITLELNLYDPVTDARWQWTAPPQTWGAWLSWDEAAAAAGAWEWSLDATAAEAYFQQQGTALGEGRYVEVETAVSAINDALSARRHQVDLRVRHTPRQHTVQPGETLAGVGRAYGIPYPWIQAANPGVDALAVGQTLTIPSPDELIPLPVAANKRIVVSITRQRVQVFEDGALKWDWPASTGVADSPTAPGVFQIQSHEENAYAGNWDLWMPHFMGIYQPVPTSDFMNGFHGFPTRGGAQLLWTNSLGRPVTYGCILVSSDNAEQLYNWAEAGVIVEIQP
jgi:lipoprotein-anchoring transpeptidase ErfK/SrfK